MASRRESMNWSYTSNKGKIIENQTSSLAPFEEAETLENPLRDLEPTDVAALQNDEAGRKTALVCRAADELKALGITVLDVRKQTIIADYFVICSGTSSTHIRSIAGNVQDKMREGGFRAKAEGDGDSLWVVIDYGDAILHVLSEETREFYDLERLWADSKISAWPEAPTNSATATSVGATSFVATSGAAQLK